MLKGWRRFGEWGSLKIALHKQAANHKMALKTGRRRRKALQLTLENGTEWRLRRRKAHRMSTVARTMEGGGDKEAVVPPSPIFERHVRASSKHYSNL